jgi:hypothetical protein
MKHRIWQETEGGPIVKATCNTHPWENRAFWRKQLRPFILQRDPLCKLCGREGSTIVDHVIPFISADGHISWVLFSDPLNLRGLCMSCHAKVTTLFDGGFGHRKSGKADYIVPTGESGRQFSAGVSSSTMLDAAIGSPEEIAELLRGIVTN